MAKLGRGVPAGYDDGYSNDEDDIDIDYTINNNAANDWKTHFPKAEVYVAADDGCRHRDVAARKKKIEDGLGPVVKRPTVSRKTILRYLDEKGPDTFFFRTDNVFHFRELENGKRYAMESHPALSKFLDVIKKYRILAIDTEGKTARISLLLGSIHGHVLIFNNARNIPNQFAEVIDDVDVYKIQSAISEDFKVLKEIGLPMTGTADTQLIFGAFVDPGVGNKVGTTRQCLFLGFPDTPYLLNKCNFEKCTDEPNTHSMRHAVEDCRVPFLTVFKAVEIHLSSLPVQLPKESNVFDYIWDCLNRVAGVPLRVLKSKGRPMKQTPEVNWLTGKKEQVHDSDLNCRADILAIEAAQKSWKQNRKIPALVRRAQKNPDTKKRHNVTCRVWYNYRQAQRRIEDRQEQFEEDERNLRHDQKRFRDPERDQTSNKDSKRYKRSKRS